MNPKWVILHFTYNRCSIFVEKDKTVVQCLIYFLVLFLFSLWIGWMGSISNQSNLAAYIQIQIQMKRKKIRQSCWNKSIDQSCRQLVEGCKNTVIIYSAPSILISLLDVYCKQNRPHYTKINVSTSREWRKERITMILLG